VKNTKLILLLIFGFLFLSCGSGRAEEVTVVYSGQTHAALYPCSCPIRQDGGILRRATLLKQLRKKYPRLLLLDGGNFTAGGRMDEYTLNTRLDMLRSEVNYKALQIMHYDAVGVGSDEFNFGREFFLKNVKKDNPAYLSANLDIDKVIPYIIKDTGGIKVAILGLTGLSARQKAEGLKVSAPSRIGELINRLKTVEGAQVLIVLSNQGEKEDLKLISKTKGIDIIIIGELPAKDEALTKIDSTFILRPAWQGRQLGKLTLKVQEGKLKDCRLEEMLLGPDISDDLQIAAILPACYSDANCKNKELVGICQNPGESNAVCEFAKPDKLNVILITRKDCRICNTAPVILRLKNKFPGLSVSNWDLSDKKAQVLIKDLGILTLPTFIFGKQVEQESNFENIKDDLQLMRNYYVLKPQASGISNFVNQEVKPGNFDLFFSLFDKDAELLLTTLEEFNPVLHFLVQESGGGFQAAAGTPEVEEDLRAVCVQKIYPEKFRDYLICRSRNIFSSYWQDCLGASESAKVASCARGAQGAGLLRGNTGLNKKLQITVGPTYLLDNQEIFSSRGGVPTKEKLKEILKKK
jgi:5'-nucleotidase